jgi:hypothetical protein
MLRAVSAVERPRPVAGELQIYYHRRLDPARGDGMGKIIVAEILLRY